MTNFMKYTATPSGNLALIAILVVVMYLVPLVWGSLVILLTQVALISREGLMIVWGVAGLGHAYQTSRRLPL